jgi:type III restriction enzyme
MRCEEMNATIQKIVDECNQEQERADIPVVWGISATVERFNESIKDMESCATLPNVIVSSKLVQDSGLLKDTINLDVPDETGDFSTVLLRRGTNKLREISEAWKEYAQQQDDADTVLPLMVLQIPNPRRSEIRWDAREYTIRCREPRRGDRAIRSSIQEPEGRPHAESRERVRQETQGRVSVSDGDNETHWNSPRRNVMGTSNCMKSPNTGPTSRACVMGDPRVG